MSFSSLKKKSGKFSNLTKEIEKMTSGGRKVDERFWKPQVDKSGNGFAVIRFLPETEGNELPWAQVWSHAFQGPGGWYIENSLTTLGAKDPVSEYNRDLWNSGNDADKDVVRRQKRKLSYYANIYVVKDPVNPHNEGGVFLFKFGKKIFDKLTAAMQPEFEDETPINPFDFWQGANFKLKIRKVDGYWNYDKSEFDAAAPLLDDDDALEALWKKEYPLADFTAQSNFKSYEDLERRLKSVLGQKQAQRPRFDEEVVNEELPPRPEEQIAATVASATSDADEDDALSYFQKLAEE